MTCTHHHHHLQLVLLRGRHCDCPTSCHVFTLDVSFETLSSENSRANVIFVFDILQWNVRIFV